MSRRSPREGAESGAESARDASEVAREFAAEMARRRGGRLRGRRGGGRPPWWPAEEAWPPRGRPPGSVARFGCLLALVAVFAFGGLVTVTAWFWGLGGHVAALGLLAGLAFGLLIFAGFFAMTMSRQFGGPLGSLIQASRAVEAGDYSVRVAELRWGPPPLRELVRTFNTMVERLQVDERQRRTLLADIGHELRTPLAVVRAELEAMLDGVHPPDEEHLGVALEETRVLARLIEDLRTLSLAEAGTLALHREPVDLAVLVNEVAAAFKAVAEAAWVSVLVDVEEDLPLLEVDPLRIREVLSNLVSNALRYSPEGSAVRVAAAATADGERVRITVTDQGRGIDPEVLPRLFDRFAKSEDSNGSGLGLAIARELVAAHGGTIEAEAAERGGTRIRVELPRGGLRPS